MRFTRVANCTVIIVVISFNVDKLKMRACWQCKLVECVLLVDQGEGYRAQWSRGRWYSPS